MTTDPAFSRDMMFVGLFGSVALADALLWRLFTRRHPATEQRPGDIGQLVGTLAGSCLLAALGLAAMGGLFVAWLAGW